VQRDGCRNAEMSPHQQLPVVVRRMTEEDVAGVLVVENSSYTDPWTADMFMSALSQEQHRLVVAWADGGPIGYGVVRIDDWVGQVLSVAVDPSHRNQAVGRAIMLELIRLAAEGGAECLRLEVRFKNDSARRLYEGLGLSVLAVRQNYYPDDDALIMGVDFGEEP
jgi:ribosomal-protein-alanine N-acetyltransferase